MRKDPTEFRERFKKWQGGEKVYEAGLPKYEEGKEKESVLYSPYEERYFVGRLTDNEV